MLSEFEKNYVSSKNIFLLYIFDNQYRRVTVGSYWETRKKEASIAEYPVFLNAQNVVSKI